MRTRWFPAVALLLCLPPAAMAASAPRLVKDINPVPYPADSSPGGFVTVGTVSFFSADDGDTGREVWRTDGTAAGTYRLTDVCPGECSANPAYFAAGSRACFFLAMDETRSFNLWVSGGTPASTVRLTGAPIQITPDFYDFPRRWVESLGLLLFVADDGVHGRELWRSDGTPAGTYLVADLRSGSQGSSIRDMTVFNGRLYFVADDGVRGPALWKSDGTPRGTVLVRDPIPGSANHDRPSQLHAAGRFLYFVAPTPTKGSELWRSNGTTRGTVPLTDLAPGAGSPTFYAFATMGDRLYFVADAGDGQELWTADGTTPGTRKLTQLTPANAFFDPTSPFLPATAVRGRLAFVADDGVHGFELWTTGGTPEGTSLVKDVCPGSCSGAQPYAFYPFGDGLVFLGTTPARGQEPWITDGTTGGTRLLRDVCQGTCGSYPYLIMDLGGRVLFATDASNGLESRLWSSNGTTRGTVPIGNFASLRPVLGSLTFTSVLNHRVIFAARDAAHGTELWASDGTEAGTQLVKNIDGGLSSYPAHLTVHGGRLWFTVANDGDQGPALWSTDGTPAGTVETRPVPEPQTFAASLLVSGGSHLFAFGGASLWITDGTPDGSREISQVRLDGDPSGIGHPSPLGETLFFAGSYGNFYDVLWKTDGTEAGTGPLLDREGNRISGPRSFQAFGGLMYFTTSFGGDLWRSDGTPAGTYPVRHLMAPGSSGTEELVRAGNRLLFPSYDRDSGTELWAIDGK